MCSSFDFIENQAFEMSENIRKETIYKFVGLETKKNSDFEKQLDQGKADGCNHVAGTWPDFITMVFLEDEAGNTYSVEPSPTGLRFAKGEITYKEYLTLQKQETVKVKSLFFTAIGFVSLLMFTVKWLLIP
jgi:hypothetical protein